MADKSAQLRRAVVASMRAAWDREVAKREAEAELTIEQLKAKLERAALLRATELVSANGPAASVQAAAAMIRSLKVDSEDAPIETGTVVQIVEHPRADDEDEDATSSPPPAQTNGHAPGSTH